MDYKRALKVWGLVLVIATVIITIYTFTYNISHKNKIKEQLDITDDEVTSVNYKQLVADIKAVEDGKNLKYAKGIEKGEQYKVNGIPNNTTESTKMFYGDRYTVVYLPSTDISVYDFYANGRCVYSVVNSALNQKGQHRKITANVKFTILYTIIIVMAIIELILYIKHQKISKNNKNIEDKKSV